MTTVLSDLGASNSVIPTRTLASATGVLYINEFYPPGVGPTGSSQTLTSLGYTRTTWVAALPAAYQSSVPSSVTGSDEADWVAAQTAEQYAYNSTIHGNSSNVATGTFVFDGHYVVNKRISVNLLSAKVLGAQPGQRFGLGGTASIQANGTIGTADAPEPILDFWTFDEQGNSAAGRATGIQPGPYIVDGITFLGNGAAVSSPPSATGYLSGIRLRQCSYPIITNCTFGNGLYDGIYATMPQLFSIIQSNNFYGVHRDAIAIWGYTNNFSTTTWIRWNEFGLVGRYAMLLDYSGGVEAAPVIEVNSLEHSSAGSYYVTHPEWFVQGLVAGCCLVGAGNAVLRDNRCEGVTLTSGYWAEWHFVSSNGVKIDGGHHGGLAFTARKSSGWRTSAAETFRTANKFYDITNDRNMGLGISGDQDGGCESVNLRGPQQDFARVYVAGGTSIGLSTSNMHSAQDVGFGIYSISYHAGTYTDVVDPTSTAVLSLSAPWGNWNFRNVNFTDASIGLRQYDSLGAWVLSSYRVRSGAASFGSWAANTTYALNDFRAPVTENGKFFQVVAVAGDAKSHATTEPTWDTAIGNNTTDNHVTWKCVGVCSYAAEDGAAEWNDGRRNRRGTGAPTAGAWSVGDKVWDNAPISGGTMGWVCTTAGTPGTWKTYGAVS